MGLLDVSATPIPAYCFTALAGMTRNRHGSYLKILLASRPNPTAPFLIGLSTSRFGRNFTQENYSLDQYLGGLRGSLPIKDWKWDAYASYGATRQTTVTRGAIDLAAFNQMLNAPDGGKSLCPAGFNPFILTPANEDPTQTGCKNFVQRTPVELVQLRQTVGEATVQGGLFDIPGPGGELRFSAGVDYRKNTYSDLPSPGLVSDNTLPSGIWTSGFKYTRNTLTLSSCQYF